MAGMGLETARRLLGRTGFGVAPWPQVEAWSRLSLEDGVDRLLAQARKAPKSSAPDWVDDPPEDVGRRKDGKERGQELKRWWFGELLTTDSPLTEWVVLFWHNHFTSSLRKTKAPDLMYRQNDTFRREGLGSFRALLHEAAREPAMLLYLDNQTNDQDQPNENFARELLELFTLGEGQGYTEQDIREAARAFTGWRVQRGKGRFKLAKHKHDEGQKTFLGRTGAWGGEDILDILLEQPQTAKFVTRKLWRALISPTPDEREVERLAQDFRKKDYDLKALLRGLLTSRAFAAPEHRGALIKSPSELLVGTARMLGLDAQDTADVLAPASRRLGQDLFEPPNVKGWPGGEAWITTWSLLARQQVLRKACIKGVDADPKAWGGDDRGAQAWLALEPCLAPAPAGASRREQLEAWLLDPVYQLK